MMRSAIHAIIVAGCQCLPSTNMNERFPRKPDDLTDHYRMLAKTGEREIMFRKLIAVLGVVAAGLSLASCAPSQQADSDKVGDTSISSSQSSAEAQTIILDVRTPEEYAAGHLDGAVSLDLNGGQLEAELSNLDPQAHYLVYCRSGNRSAAASQLLRDAQFTSVTDLGSLESAAEETGLNVVTP